MTGFALADNGKCETFNEGYKVKGKHDFCVLSFDNNSRLPYLFLLKSYQKHL